MKILVIGGTRFFGKRFVQHMLERGHDVTILTRGLSADHFGAKVQRLVADRKNKAQIAKAIKSDYDVVVDNMLMNAQEAKDIADVLRNRIGHYVMTSTLSVYNPKSGPLYESDFEAVHNIPQQANHPGEEYQQGKRAAEQVLSDVSFAVSIMRIPIIVGSDDYTKRLLSHIEAIQNKKPMYFPNLEAQFSYLHAQDAARALSWLCHGKPKGTFNISAPNAWTIGEFLNCIEKVTGQKFILGNESDMASSFGISEDYFMNVDKAKGAGFEVAPLESWMPNLIGELAHLS